MVTLHKKDTIPLSEHQADAAREVLDKVRALTRPVRLFFSTPRLFLRSHAWHAHAAALTPALTGVVMVMSLLKSLYTAVQL